MDDMGIWVALACFVVLLALSGFFSSSETAIFSLSDRQLAKLRRDKHPRVELIEHLLAEPRRLIITILLGNELVNVAASVLSAAIVIQLLGADSKWLNMLIMVPLLLLFGEITPKTLAINNNVRFATFECRPLHVFAKVATPIRWLVRLVADFFITLIVGPQRSRGNIITEDMVRVLAKEAVGEGALDGLEAELIEQIFEFGRTSLMDVLTPRSHIFYLHVDTTVDEAVEAVKRTKHTKIPVFREHRDDIVGILHARDLVGADLQALAASPKALESKLRPPLLVPETKSADDLFRTFRERQLSVALTVDEYGGVTGLVSMEDLLECIFGEIHSPSERRMPLRGAARGHVVVDGAMPLRAFSVAIDGDVSSEHAETVGGMLLHEFGELPHEGSAISRHGLRFVVQQVRNNRIRTVLVQRERRGSSRKAEA
jgi:CBS domain containing-hemolysin-like protein